MTMGPAIADTASVMRIALVGSASEARPHSVDSQSRQTGPGRGTALDIVDCPENLGRGRAFGSDTPAAAVNTSQRRLEALSPRFIRFAAGLTRQKPVD